MLFSSLYLIPTLFSFFLIGFNVALKPLTKIRQFDDWILPEDAGLKSNSEYFVRSTYYTSF